MRFIELDIKDNPIGADPLVGLYRAINKVSPELSLTQGNSKVIDIRPYVRIGEPFFTRAIVQDQRTMLEYDFYYNRIDTASLIIQPFWKESEATFLEGLVDSYTLIKKIGEKTSQNLDDTTHWCSRTSIEYTGGRVTPNFLFKALYNSVYFAGETILQLHDKE